MMPNYRALLIGAVVLALLLRLLFCLGYWVDKPLTHDEQEYLLLAQNLRAGRGLVYEEDGREHFGRAPGYPVFLATVLSLRDDVRAVRIAQSLAAAIGVLLIAALANLAAGRGAARLAAYMAALYPPLIWMPAYILSETLYSMLILAAGWILWKALELPKGSASRRGAVGFFLAGMITGLAALTRPVAMPFLALALLFLVVRRAPAAALAVLLGAVLVVAPWTAYKSTESGRFILIASEGGITLWTGNNPRAIGEGDMAANPAIKELNREIRARHSDLGPDQLEQVYNREALRFIVGHPLQWSWLVAKKLFYTWVPIGPSYILHSTRFLVATVPAYLVVLPFGLLGWGLLARRRRPRPVVLYLLVGSVLATNLVFFPQERFRVPVLDPMLLIGAAVWLDSGRLGAWLSGRREASLRD